MIDLHVHTTASDGSTKPEDLVDLAIEKGLTAIAITDHDTTDGCKQAVHAAVGKNIEIVPGIEFGTKYSSSVHILGFYLDLDNEELNDALINMVKSRDARNEEIVRKMQKDGIDITYEQMKERFGDVIGRPHFAQILEENNMVSSVSEAFSTYLGKGMKYWLPRSHIPIERCIELIRNAGGVPILAHPFEYKVDLVELEDLAYYCYSLGIQGIEVLHPSHSEAQCAMLNRLSNRYDLLKTGGSDYHGLDVKPNNPLGVMNAPDEWLNALKETAIKNKSKNKNGAN